MRAPGKAARGAATLRRDAAARRVRRRMSPLPPLWIVVQVLIVLFVAIGMAIAITKLV
jgi:hypothetical protein